MLLCGAPGEGIGRRTGENPVRAAKARWDMDLSYESRGQHVGSLDITTPSGCPSRWAESSTARATEDGHCTVGEPPDLLQVLRGPLDRAGSSHGDCPGYRDGDSLPVQARGIRSVGTANSQPHCRNTVNEAASRQGTWASGRLGTREEKDGGNQREGRKEE